MNVSSAELLFALRSPSSGWLAAMICALVEAVQDPSFTGSHRELIHRLLEVKKIPPSVANAATERLSCFEHSVYDTSNANTGLFEQSEPLTTSRPKLTLCGNSDA